MKTYSVKAALLTAGVLSSSLVFGQGQRNSYDDRYERDRDDRSSRREERRDDRRLDDRIEDRREFNRRDEDTGTIIASKIVGGVTGCMTNGI